MPVNRRLPSSALLLLSLPVIACAGAAQSATSAGYASGEPPLKLAPSPTSAALTPADLRARLYIFADDSMQGRRSGTVGGMKGTAYIASEARRIGLEPAGDNGTYFQNLPLYKRTLDPQSDFGVAGARFTPWTDYLPRDQGAGAVPLEGVQVIYAGTWGDPALLPAGRAAGKLVVFSMPLGPDGAPTWSPGRDVATARFRSAAGIAVASLDAVPATDLADLRQPSLQFGDGDAMPIPSFMYITLRAASALTGALLEGLDPGATGRTVQGGFHFFNSPTDAPARNVVAILRGSDPSLRGEYVAIGAHNDHEGMLPEGLDHDSLRAFNEVFRPGGANSAVGAPTPEKSARVQAILDSLRRRHPARRDSIMNGADDDGSGTVTVLEIAEAMANGKEKPRRSVLFVWHAAEELGLLGSKWYTGHPTVPRDSIVTQLNIDMVGRGGPADEKNGGPGYLQLIGSRRLSTELGDLVESVNASGKFGERFDYQYDADGHPDNYYCRSDHYNYARYGILIAFFTTGGHRDYHQITDEPQYIDYDQMARVGRLIMAVALDVADLDHRVVVDQPKPDPQAPCKQ
ncbi:MAG: M28 family metallopeptidase [Gemmatimonadales bacterium]